MHPKMSNLAHLLRLCVEQVQNCRCERRHLEFVLPVSRVLLGCSQLELLPTIILRLKIAAVAVLSLDSRRTRHSIQVMYLVGWIIVVADDVLPFSKERSLLQVRDTTCFGQSRKKNTQHATIVPYPILSCDRLRSSIFRHYRPRHERCVDSGGNCRRQGYLLGRFSRMRNVTIVDASKSWLCSLRTKHEFDSLGREVGIVF